MSRHYERYYLVQEQESPQTLPLIKSVSKTFQLPAFTLARKKKLIREEGLPAHFPVSYTKYILVIALLVLRRNCCRSFRDKCLLTSSSMSRWVKTAILDKRPLDSKAVFIIFCYYWLGALRKQYIYFENCLRFSLPHLIQCWDSGKTVDTSVQPSLNFRRLLRVVFSSQQRLNRPAVNAFQWRHYPSLP